MSTQSTTLTTLETLRRAREIISDPAHWTKGEYARNAKGREVSPIGKAATCWCSLGAIRKATGINAYAPESELSLEEGTDGLSASYFNDSHTHAEVLAMFDKAIAAESAR